MDDSYDLVVIGAGPAGEVAAELAAAFGRTVLIVERNKPGGVVTTTGGAPTKALREAALYLTGYRQEEVYGVRAAAPLEVVMPTLRARVEHVRDVLQEAVAHRFVVRGIAYLQGVAQLDADRTVHITSPDGPEREVAARAVLVATGSRPTHYPGIPFDDPDVYDSDEIYSLRTVPNDIVIVGGGPIGVEFATVFTALGIPATLISNSDRLLPNIDGELAGLVANEFKRRGVRLVLGVGADGREARRRPAQGHALDRYRPGRGRRSVRRWPYAQHRRPRPRTGRRAPRRPRPDRRRPLLPDDRSRDLRRRRRGQTRPRLQRHAARTRSSGPCLRTRLRRGDRPDPKQRRLRLTRSRQRRSDRRTDPGHRHPLRGGPLRPGQHPTRGDRRPRRAAEADLPRRRSQAARRPLLRRHRLRSGRPGPRVLQLGGRVELFLTLALNTPTYSYAYHDATVDGLTRLTGTMGLAADAPTSPADTASAARR